MGSFKKKNSNQKVLVLLVFLAIVLAGSRLLHFTSHSLSSIDVKPNERRSSTESAILDKPFLAQTISPATAVATSSVPNSVRLWAVSGETKGEKLDPKSASYAKAQSDGLKPKGRSAYFDSSSLTSLAALRHGDNVLIPLLSGQQVTGKVNLVQQEDGWVRVGGELTGSRSGSFSLASSGKKVGGTILIPEEKIAYAIAEQPDGQVSMEEKDLSDIICFPMPGSKDKPAPTKQAAGAQGAPPILSSRPAATAVLYMDFDGETVTDSSWNNGNTIVAQPSSLTSAQIIEVWNRVKEDYWPFNIDVTTDLNRYNNAPVGSRMRCIITPTDTAGPGYGGYAFLYSFAQAGQGQFSSTIPCWVFDSNLSFNPKNVAEAVSHEFGHTFGLHHDGGIVANDKTEGFPGSENEYYHGYPADSGSAVGWAPIMGVGYYEQLVQWSKGEYANANNTSEDDIAIIANVANGFGFVADEAGNSVGSAATLNVSGVSVNQTGIISGNNDVDFYVFTVPSAATVSINADPSSISPNLDILLQLQNSVGTILASSNPDTNLNAAISYTAAAGTYYIKVQGTGRGAVLGNGYSSYGSIGHYSLSGSIVGSITTNDQCSGAVTLTSGVTNSLNTANATSTGDPTPSCGSGVGKGVWYKLTPTNSGTVTVSTCGSAFDTVLAIYSGSCGSFTSVACDDDGGCSNNTSAVSFNGTAGTTYYILAGGYSGASGNLKIAATLPFVKATAIVTLGSLSQTYNGSARSVTATTSPAGLTVNFTYNGSPNAPTNAGSYTVIGTINNPNYQGSATNTLVINLPVITTQPLSQTVNAGDFASFSVGVTGTGLQYQWSFNGTNLVGKTNSTLVLNATGTNQAGIYRVLVSVGSFSLTSDPAELIVPLPGKPGSKKWQFNYGGTINTTPALSKDGTIYIAAENTLIALDPSGSQKWTLSLPGVLYASPTIADNGMIYVGAWWFTTLYAVNPNGTLRWQSNLPGWSSTYSQSIADDGTIIVSLGGELTSTRVYALDTNGTPKWNFDAGGRPSGAALAYDGTIYIGNNDTNQFFALHPSGTSKWGLMGIFNPTMPAIGADGTIYVGGSFDLQFRAFRPDGTVLWQYPTSTSVVGTTATVGTDGTIYIATIWDGKIYALNPDGTLKWVHDLGDRTYIGMALSKQGTIYTSANEKRFLAINPDGNTQWQFVTGSQDINPNEGRRSSPTIAPDGTIYFPVNQPGIGGVIFAIQGDSGPAESSWPMAFQNAQHTSHVPFAITNQPVSQIVLIGSNAVLSVGVASTQPCVYQWRHNGTNLLNQTNATLLLPNAAPIASGVYACLVSNRSGAFVSHNASLTVTSSFALRITQQGMNVQLSWPAAFSNYTLLASVSVSGGGWTTNTNPRTISGSNIFVTLPATNTQMFYRAVSP